MKWIRLDAGARSDLDWSAEKAIAEACEEKIVWELDLFSGMHRPLTNQTQCLSLGLALDHFRDTLWEAFQERTAGIVLYRGTVHFDDTFPWDADQEKNLQGWLEELYGSVDWGSSEEMRKDPFGHHLLHLYCRDVIAGYLELLLGRLPPTLTPYILLDESVEPDPLQRAELTAEDRLQGLKVWREEVVQPSIGVCLPVMDLFPPQKNSPLEQVFALRIPLRVIPEAHLITAWDGLDYLIVAPSLVSKEGKRKLQGFCAAGGCVISLEEKMGLPYEESFQTWRSESNDTFSRVPGDRAP